MITTRTHTLTAAVTLALATSLSAAAAEPAMALVSTDVPASTDGSVPVCSIKLLPVPAGSIASSVGAGDPGGRMLAGTVWDAGGTERVIVWEDRVPRVVNGPHGLFFVESISSNGTVAGSSENGFGFVITPDGVSYKVTARDGATVEVVGVADDGTVAGTVWNADLTSDPALWASSAYDEPTVLPVPGGLSGIVTGMAPNGSIAVSTDRGGGAAHSRLRLECRR